MNINRINSKMAVAIDHHQQKSNSTNSYLSKNYIESSVTCLRVVGKGSLSTSVSLWRPAAGR